MLLIVVAILNIIFAFVIIVRNYHVRINILLALTMISNVLWALGDAMMISAGTVDDALLWSRVFFIAPMLTAFFLILFAYSFPDNKKLPIVQTVLLAIPIIVMSGVTIVGENLLVNEFFKGERINEYMVNTRMFLLYGLFFVLYFSISYVILFVKSRQHRGIEKIQINYVLVGAVASSSLALISNILLPFFGNTKFVWVGPLLTLIYVFFSTYAIAKHHLFDIRATIARSVAYVLALASMLAIYVIMIFGVSDSFIDTSGIDSSQRIIYALFAVILAFTYQPLKKFFDKLTDKIFYRQSYDSEQILNEYSDFLVDEVETDEIIDYTLIMLNSALNPESAYIILYKNGAGEWYDNTGIILGDTRDAMARALEYQKPSILTSDLSGIREDEFTKNIKDHLAGENVRLSVKLSTHGQLEGFILLGEKKNGSRYSPDDYKFLTTVANELSVSLQNSERFDEIEKFNKTLKEQIEAATKQLRASNRKLQSLDQAKDEFISMASHQLRTPLTSVKGYVSMMMDGDAGPVTDDQKRLLGEAFASSQRMVYLISDLLNVSRLKTGKFIIEKTSVNLPKMVEQEVTQLIPSAQTRNLTLSYAPPTRFPELMLDETKTRQVVMNFIDNAIYYTKSGGQIEVNLRVNKNQVEYRVKDSGIGVPTRDQHKLFTKFFRARNARSARPDGTGLGLYMAQKIITAQGGSIHFVSKEGKGSEFGFNLPLSPPTTTKKSDR